MPVSARDLYPSPAPEQPPDIRLILAGIFIAILLILGARVALFGPPRALPPATAPTAIVVEPTAAPLATLAIVVEPTAAPALTARPAPTPAPATAVAAPEPAPTAPGCPAAVTLPDGARVGWVARAAGCADVVLANLGGRHQWVLRGDLSDELFLQLPEVQP